MEKVNSSGLITYVPVLAQTRVACFSYSNVRERSVQSSVMTGLISITRPKE